MGSGKMEKRVVGKIPLVREVNNVNLQITDLFKSNHVCEGFI